MFLQRLRLSQGLGLTQSCHRMIVTGVYSSSSLYYLQKCPYKKRETSPKKKKAKPMVNAQTKEPEKNPTSAEKDDNTDEISPTSEMAEYIRHSRVAHEFRQILQNGATSLRFLGLHGRVITDQKGKLREAMLTYGYKKPYFLTDIDIEAEGLVLKPGARLDRGVLLSLGRRVLYNIAETTAPDNWEPHPIEELEKVRYYRSDSTKGPYKLSPVAIAAMLKRARERGFMSPYWLTQTDIETEQGRDPDWAKVTFKEGEETQGIIVEMETRRRIGKMPMTYFNFDQLQGLPANYKHPEREMPVLAQQMQLTFLGRHFSPESNVKLKEFAAKRGFRSPYWVSLRHLEDERALNPDYSVRIRAGEEEKGITLSFQNRVSHDVQSITYWNTEQTTHVGEFTPPTRKHRDVFGRVLPETYQRTLDKVTKSSRYYSPYWVTREDIQLAHVRLGAVWETWVLQEGARGVIFRDVVYYNLQQTNFTNPKLFKPLSSDYPASHLRYIAKSGVTGQPLVIGQRKLLEAATLNNFLSPYWFRASALDQGLFGNSVVLKENAEGVSVHGYKDEKGDPTEAVYYNAEETTDPAAIESYAKLEKVAPRKDGGGPPMESAEERRKKRQTEVWRPERRPSYSLPEYAEFLPGVGRLL